MSKYLLLASLFLAAPHLTFTQEPASALVRDDPKVGHTELAAPNEVLADIRLAKAADEKTEADIPEARDTKPATFPIDYVRPNKEQRFRNYLNNAVGPAALIHYVGTAGLLTLRNSPKEWGSKPDGYARRLANVASKGIIRSTTVYGLDEALKLDSTFYRSRDRSVAARLRNSVFSTVTARDRRGRRVIGIPNIVGGLVSNVTASSVWYPSRYNYVHGLKGGAISLGVNAGVNILKEFVWKR